MMYLLSHFAALITLGVIVIATPVANATTSGNGAGVAFYDPTAGGGSFLDKSAGLGEPLNIIISGLSSPAVLTPAGFLNYARAIGFSIECFGLHNGGKQEANLGDGHNWVPEREVLRQSFEIPILGTCFESLFGGNHLRVFRQDGPSANSGALFLAVSQEKDLADKHDIVPNGYNIGRDNFVKSAVGHHGYLGIKYNTTVEELEGLLEPGSMGVNHGIAQDGVVKLLTVTIL